MSEKIWGIPIVYVDNGDRKKRGVIITGAIQQGEIIKCPGCGAQDYIREYDEENDENVTKCTHCGAEAYRQGFN